MAVDTGTNNILTATRKIAVGHLLKRMKYKLRVNRKQIAAANGPTRNQQFLYIGERRHGSSRTSTANRPSAPEPMTRLRGSRAGGFHGMDFSGFDFSDSEFAPAAIQVSEGPFAKTLLVLAAFPN